MERLTEKYPDFFKKFIEIREELKVNSATYRKLKAKQRKLLEDVRVFEESSDSSSSSSNEDN